MNIGIVTTWFERGAAYVSRQYRDVLKQQHCVFIYARGGEQAPVGDPVWDDTQVTWGKPSRLSVPTAIDLADLELWLTKNKIELVLFNEQHWWNAITLCNHLGIITGAYIDYYTEQTVPFFANYDFLICNTKRHYSVFNWHPQCIYTPWGTDTEIFVPQSFEPVKQGRLTFFHSCGVSPERKGTGYVLEAFAALPAEARLVVHSQCDLTAKLPEQAQLIESLIQQGRLEYLQQTVAAPGLFHLGDVYVYPTKLDGLGLTLMEALACGLPVIASDNGPMNEFIEQGINGRVVKIKRLVARTDGYYWPQCWVDTADLTEQMNWYVQHLTELSRCKSEARAYAVKHLDWRKNAKELPAIFAGMQARPLAEKAKAEALALRFEQQRLTAQDKYPLLFNLGSKVLKTARLVTGRPNR